MNSQEKQAAAAATAKKNSPEHLAAASAALGPLPGDYIVFEVTDGHYTSPECMRGVPVQKITEDGPYWKQSWKRLEDWPKDNDPNKSQAVMKFLDECSIHPNQLLAKSYYDANGLAQARNPTIFRRILKTLDLVGVEDPVLWFRRRLAHLVRLREQEGRPFGLKRTLQTFHEVEPVYAKLYEIYHSVRFNSFPYNQPAAGKKRAHSEMSSAPPSPGGVREPPSLRQVRVPTLADAMPPVDRNGNLAFKLTLLRAGRQEWLDENCPLLVVNPTTGEGSYERHDPGAGGSAFPSITPNEITFLRFDTAVDTVYLQTGERYYGNSEETTTTLSFVNVEDAVLFVYLLISKNSAIGIDYSDVDYLASRGFLVNGHEGYANMFLPPDMGCNSQDGAEMDELGGEVEGGGDPKGEFGMGGDLDGQFEKAEELDGEFEWEFGEPF